MNDPTTNDRDPLDALDDAIDRTVREMTHVAADDRAVARVMARVREADTPAEGWRWMLTPRVAAGCGIVALLLMLLLNWPSWHSLRRGDEGWPVAVTAPTESSQQPQPLAAREFPTRVAAAPSTTQATTAARMARRGDTVKPASVASHAADVSVRDRVRIGRNAQPELPPFESDIKLASITPAPLDEAAAIPVEPLSTLSLTVDEIPLSSIEMPPVSPEQQK